MPDHFSSERVVIAKVQKGGAGKDAQAGEKKSGQALQVFFPGKENDACADRQHGQRNGHLFSG